MNAEEIEAERLISILALVVFMAWLMVLALSGVEERILRDCES